MKRKLFAFTQALKRFCSENSDTFDTSEWTYTQDMTTLEHAASIGAIEGYSYSEGKHPGDLSKGKLVS